MAGMTAGDMTSSPNRGAVLPQMLGVQGADDGAVDAGSGEGLAQGVGRRFGAGVHSGQGDLYIQIMVETPVKLTKRQKELLREFDKTGNAADTSPESAGFFDKVKELWNDFTE